MTRPAQHAVVVERNILIDLGDGISLAGDLFMPETPGRYPAVVSYYPYHKDDVIGALLDHPNRYFAARGYASLLVDFRGLGNSDGVVPGFMDPAEAIDSAGIVEWAAGQPWCDGSVGMWGMSYGGVTALQAAAKRPPHLKAIVPMNGSIDPNEEWIYPGGCLNALGEFGLWGPWMIAMSLLPPLFQDEAGRWYRVWQDRLKTLGPPYVLPFQLHPEHDDYWRTKIIPAEQVEVPAYFMTGWRDQNPQGVIEAFERVKGPSKLLVGPWMHSMPDLAPIHRIDYLAEMTRWWDTWLRGERTGIEAEPPVTVFVQGVGWRHEPAWPIPGSTPRLLYLGAGGELTEASQPKESSMAYRANPTVGATAGLWDPAGTGLGMPRDQGPDDLRSVTFTGPALPADLEITGRPEATIHVAFDEGSDANLVVKLCDVAPDGRSALITSGWLRARHRTSHELAEALATGEFSEFHVQLVTTAYLVKAGHRLRLAVSCSDFPRIWPTPTNPAIRVAYGGRRPSGVSLPVVQSSGVPGPDLPAPDQTVNRTPLDIEGRPRYRVEHDVANDTLTVTVGLTAALQTGNRDGRYEMDRTAKAYVSASRPDTALVTGEAILTARTPSGSTVVAEGRTRMTLFGQTSWGRVAIDGQTIFERQWVGGTESMPDDPS